jgi:hypothetical protein
MVSFHGGMISWRREVTIVGGRDNSDEEVVVTGEEGKEFAEANAYQI